MRRTKRRLWTIALTIAATLTLLLALVVGGFRLLVSVAPDYTQDIATRVSAQLGRQVAIQSVNLTWRRLHPSLDLGGVTIMGDDGHTPVLKLDEMNVSLDWAALCMGQIKLVELRLVGPTVTVERMADGSLRLSGIDHSKPLTMDDLQNIANGVARIGRLVIAKGQMLWVDVEDPNTFRRVTDIDLIFSAGGSRHRLRVKAALPPDIGDKFSLDIKASGALSNLRQLNSQASLEAKGLRPGIWLQPYLQPGVKVSGDDAEIELDSEWRGERLIKANGVLRSGELAAERPGAHEALWQDFSAKLTAAAHDKGWRADFSDITIERESVGKPEAASGYVDYQPGEGEDGPILSGGLSHLQLEDVAVWLPLFNAEGRPWLPLLNPRGSAEELAFHFQQRAAQGPAYQFQGLLKGVGIDAAAGHPGVTGLDAVLAANDVGGEAKLDMKDGMLVMPAVFDKPLPLQLVGAVKWQHAEGDAWNVSSEALDWHGPSDVKGNSSFTLQIPGGDQVPVIDLDTHFTGSDIASVKPFIPHVKALHESVREWLARAIQRATVTSGTLKLQGRLDHFPYQNTTEPGLFRLDMDLRDTVLDYVPGWPRLENLSGHLAFEGRSMLISNGSGRTLGTPLSGVTVSISDFLKPVLNVKGQSAGDAGRMLSFLSESPLRTDYQGLAKALKLQGPARLDLDLGIPLENLKAAQVHGVVTLDGQVRLDHASLPEPVTGLTGQVEFDREGLRAKNLQGNLMGLTLNMQLSPQNDAGHKLTRLILQTEASFPRDNAELEKFVSPRWLQHFNGSSQWQGEMLFDASASPSKLHLQSDLAGLESTLPKPLDKTRNDVKPLTILLDPSRSSGMRADVNFGGAVTAAVLLAQSQQKWIVQSATLHLGPGTASLPAVPSIWVEGTLPELDATQWQSLLASTTPATPEMRSAEASADTAPAAAQFKGADVRFGRLLIAGQVFPDSRLQLARSDTTWLLTASGPALEGVVKWPLQDSGRRIYRADLAKLSLRHAEQPKTTQDQSKTPAKDQPAPVQPADKPKEKPTDPAQLPGLSLRCRSVKLGDFDFGSLQMEVFPVARGLRLEAVSLNGNGGQIQGTGDWMRTNDQSSGHLSIRGNSSKVREIMTALGYSPSLQAEKAKLNFDIAWTPNVDGLVPQSIDGALKLELEKGSLLAVSPGAGRVLGLFNFYALPRRLTLDFRDVVSEGFIFDTLNGDFKITQGNAYTTNLKMVGPSAKMRIKGRVGLAARDYDQSVSIQPQVSSGVAVAGAALGGPAVGAMLLLAQQLFKKPLNEVSELTYHLGGTWDNPEIEKAGSNDKFEPEKNESKTEPKAEQKTESAP